MLKVLNGTINANNREWKKALFTDIENRTFNLWVWLSNQ